MATCVCKGQTVFEGAVIGQVFTGDVQMQCPHQPPTECLPSGRLERAIERAHPLSTALIALGIWHASYPAVEGMMRNSPVLQAIAFFIAGIGWRYLVPAVVSRVRLAAIRALSAKPSPRPE